MTKLHSFSTEDLERRPKLNLKPRSVPTSVDKLAEGTSRMAIFGGGKPRDEKEYEQKVRERKTSQSSDDRGTSST